MNTQLTLEQSYLALIEFLMLSKQRIIEIGTNNHLSSMQTITLLLLKNPRPMGTLRRIFNCDASNITGIVDGLEQKNLATRFDINSDRRVKMIRLLPNGKKLRNILVHELTNDHHYLLGCLSEYETKNFIELIQKITAATKAQKLT